MIRRIGEAENPYVVRVAEEDYAGPRSIFPTSSNIEDRRHQPPIYGPHTPRSMTGAYADQYLQETPPAGLDVPDKAEMLRRLKMQRDAEDMDLLGATEVPRKRMPDESFISPGRKVEEDHAGPRSIFPTPNRLIGDAENPYTIPPESSLGGMRQLGDTDARSRWRDAPPLIKEGESKNIEDRRGRDPGRPPKAPLRSIDYVPRDQHLTVPDQAEMERRLEFQRDADMTIEEMEAERKYWIERDRYIKERGLRDDSKKGSRR